MATGNPVELGLNIAGVNVTNRLVGTDAAGNAGGIQPRLYLTGEAKNSDGSLNPAAFGVPGIADVGPYDRFYVRNPGFSNHDLSVFKNIPARRQRQAHAAAAARDVQRAQPHAVLGLQHRRPTSRTARARRERRSSTTTRISPSPTARGRRETRGRSGPSSASTTRSATRGSSSSRPSSTSEEESRARAMSTRHPRRGVLARLTRRAFLGRTGGLLATTVAPAALPARRGPRPRRPTPRASRSCGAASTSRRPAPGR